MGFDLGGFAGGVLGGLGSYFGQREANKANIKMNREQMAFQKSMSNSAHFREVRDLRNAGLNPILSATGGSGASTPQGSQARVENEIGPAIATALEAKRLSADLNKIDAETSNIQANTQVANTQNKLISAQISGAVGKSKVDSALGKTVDMIMPGINTVNKLVQPSQNSSRSPFKQTTPIQLKTKD